MTLSDLLEANSFLDGLRALCAEREAVCRAAWELTEPTYRYRLTIYEQFRPGKFTSDWWIASDLAPSHTR